MAKTEDTSVFEIEKSGDFSMKIRGCGTVRFRWLERYTASGMSFQSFPTTLFFSKMEKEKEASEISDEISWPALFFRES
ncbi:hypothetical protein J4419_01900 [Candidatus Woesearchaeota archaeon]|nr:hypothetical protein [Candidatus Woesearchaeota archaeon]